MGKRAPVLFLMLTAVLAASGLGIYGFANAPREEASMDETTIVIAADPHYIAPELTDHGEYFENMIENADGKVTEYVDELTDVFLAQVTEMRPAALIVAGDLTLNGARISHETLARKLEAVEAAGVPVLVMPGNHDLNCHNAARFHGDGFTRVESVTAAEFAEIYADCGFSGALARDSASLSYVYALGPSLRVLMLDVNTEETPQAVGEETLAWVEGQLADAAGAGARVIAVSHQNVFRHNKVIYEGYVIKNADALLALYERYGVLANFSGHLHCQHIAHDDAGFYEAATGSLSVSPNQFGVIRLTARALFYETVQTDVSGWAAENGLSDPNLLDFAAYSLGFFTGAGRAQSPDWSDAQIDFFGRLNAAYFSGRMDTIDPDDPGFGLLSDEGFYAVYAESIRDDIGKDFTRLTLEW